MENEMLTWALSYARKGMSVFPLKEYGKDPHTTNGFKNATTDEAQIETWWRNWPEANIGIATGAMSNGICVIDIDIDEESGKNGKKSINDWMQRYGSFKESWIVKTGKGGAHYYFRSNEEIRNRVNIIPGVDIRGDGGYVVAPPSIHPNGTPYQWKPNSSPDDIQIVEQDGNITFFLHKDDTRLRTSFSAPDIIRQGERNDALFKIACMMQAKGLSDEAVYASVSAENEAKCNPPVSERELTKIVESALKYEKGKPVYIDQQGNVVQGQREPMFSLNEKGKIKPTIENCCEAIEYSPGLYGKIRFNELANNIYAYGSLPWNSSTAIRPWLNSDDSNLRMLLESEYGLRNTETINDALTISAERHKFNPITDYLEQISSQYGECDGAIRKLLVEYMGCKDNEYNYEVMKVFMLGAIARAYKPGQKFDYCIILYGPQGFGKSMFLRTLALNGEWFNDNFATFEGDKAIEKLSGMWIVEMAELKALKSAKDAESFKSFLTSTTDTYRKPYARRAEQVSRRCVFAGTTNSKNIFVDKTGNRRFLPIICRKGYETKSLFDPDQKAVREDFEKGWAEAMNIYKKANGEPKLTLPQRLLKFVESMQESFAEEDYRVGLIQNWLDNTDATKVCTPMVAEYALDLDIAKTSKKEMREIREILENEISGWTRLQTKDNRGRSRFQSYGLQTAFIKDVTD